MHIEQDVDAGHLDQHLKGVLSMGLVFRGEAQLDIRYLEVQALSSERNARPERMFVVWYETYIAGNVLAASCSPALRVFVIASLVVHRLG